MRGFGSWPYGDKRCVVLAHDPPHRAARRDVPRRSAAPLLQRLHADGVRRVYVDGGAVIRQFLGDGLIDDITLSIIPVSLGDGIRLFDGAGPGRRLRLQTSQAFASGLVQLTYEVTRDPL